MSPRLVLLAALCGLNPALQAQSEDLPLGGEPRIVPGTFAASDSAAQPLALWLEQGGGVLSTAAQPAETAPALRLAAQVPAARACLLLDAPEAEVASIRLRLKLEAASEVPGSAEAAPETVEWELAGVPLRFVSAEAGTSRWQVDFHTVESGWRPLLAPEGEDLGAGTSNGWHTLTLEFSPAPATAASSTSSPASRSWRLRWDEREPGPWIAQTRAEPALLVIGAGLRSTLWLDDVSTTAAAGAPSADPEAAAAALAARNAALREEIASALHDLTRETGVRRRLLRRPAAAGVRPAAMQHLSGARRLEVLTPLEDKHSSDSDETP